MTSYLTTLCATGIFLSLGYAVWRWSTGKRYELIARIVVIVALSCVVLDAIRIVIFGPNSLP